MNLPRISTLCAALSLLLAAPACVNSAYRDIQVDAAANPKTDFDGYSTYAWAATAAMVRDPDAEWSPPDMDIGAEIVHLVDREMRDRNMTQVSESPDVLVMYAIGFDMTALDLVTDDQDGSMHFKSVPKSGLKIVLFDPESRRIMWVGSAEAKITEGITVELATQRLDYAITKMFDKSAL